MLHPTWVCTQALQDRDFQIKRNQLQNFIEKLVRDTNIDRCVRGSVLPSPPCPPLRFLLFWLVAWRKK